MNLNNIAQLYCASLLLFASTSLFALEITVVDNQGKPLQDAVIGLSIYPSGDSEQEPNSEESMVMDQIDFQFFPKTLVINKRQWVDFPNSDNVRHHVYSFSSTKPFEIKMFKGSDAEPVQFNKPGIVVLGCNIHDSMVGYIYVGDDQVTALTNAQGMATIKLDAKTSSLLSRDKQQLITATLWHPSLSIAQTQRVQIKIDPNLSQQTILANTSQDHTNESSHKNGFVSKFGMMN
jgi:plastocyanin